MDHRDATSAVEKSVTNFKTNVEEKLKISSQGYDIVFKDGKASAVGKISSTGKAVNADDLKKIQDILDNPTGNAITQNLLNNIDQYNQLSSQLIDNELTQHVYGGEQDRYLPKSVSKNWLMEGTNYSNVSTGNDLYNKYVEIVAAANVKYHAALEDGSHFTDGRTDPGILEATRIRESVSIQV